MFSLQKLLGHEDKLFGLLEASAREARKSVQALVALSSALNEPLVLDEFVRLRATDKNITKEISGAMYANLVTSLDRADIANLSLALYRIPKMVDKFAERLLHSPPDARKTDFSQQVGVLERATDTLLEMVGSLRRNDLDGIRILNERLQSLENEADRQIMDHYRDLFGGGHGAILVLALRDLYEQLEKAIDRCRDAGNVVAHIALKNS